MLSSEINPYVSLRSLSPHDRVAAILDAGSIAAVDAVLAAPRASPHLQRWGITAQDNDGLIVFRGTLQRQPVLLAAQDERFLGGSVGINHGIALAALFARARSEACAAVILLAASGGVRLHEANGAELALARALAALLDARASGVPVFAIGVGDVFGGASVLACAADRLALLPGIRLGLSGPRVIESAHGKSELDADDAAGVDALFGAQARNAAGHVELLADDADAARGWIVSCMNDPTPFASRVAADQARLAARLAAAGVAPAMAPSATTIAPLLSNADAVDRNGWLWKMRDQPIWIAKPSAPATFGPSEAHTVDAALAAAANQNIAGRTLILVEDSAGHEATHRAEALCVSHYLAHHAAVLALLRARGFSLSGLLAGLGHSAAFFANALQAPTLFAVRDARVVAMEPPAIARVTRLDPAQLAALIDDDPLLGQPVRCFAQSGGVAGIIRSIDESTLSIMMSATRVATAP